MMWSTFQNTQLELSAAAAAVARLQAVERIAIRARGWERAKVRKLRDIVANGDVAVVEHRADAEGRLMRLSTVDHRDGLRRNVDTIPLAAQQVSGDAGGRAVEERVEHQVASFAIGLSDATKRREPFLRG